MTQRCFFSFSPKSLKPCSTNLPGRSSGLSGSSGVRSPVTTGGLGVPAGSSTSGLRGSEAGAGNLPITTSSGGSEAGLRDNSLLSTGGSLLSLTLDSLLLLSFGIAVEVEIDHDVPVNLPRGDGAAETENLTGEQPPDETD